LRRFLDRLYAASGALAAVCLASIAAVMLAQAGMRELGFLLRGADDIVAWLCAGCAFVGYMLYAVARFVYESWKFNEVAQGLIAIPIWIPQMSFVAGALILFVAMVDEFLVLARGGKPAYEAAEDERRVRKDFSETL
jgi:TRAP-type C4-dicarboxylate transport system permease small subunit